MINLLNSESEEIKKFLEYLNTEYKKYCETLKTNSGNNWVHDFKLDENESKLLIHMAFGINKIEPRVMKSWSVFIKVKPIIIDAYDLYIVIDKETGNIYRKNIFSIVSKFDLVGNVKTFEYCEI